MIHGWLGTVILVAAVGPSVGRAADAVRPNIVYVIADDLGFGDVHALNPERGKIPTPHLDRLAAEGMKLLDCHGGSSVCTPTRYGVLTGRYAWRTRLQSGVLDGDSPPLIAADRRTAAGLLRDAGYRTVCIGKWHLGMELAAAESTTEPNTKKPAKPKKPATSWPVGTRVVGGPTTRGFDEYFGFSHARSMSALVENDRVIETIAPVDMLPRLTERAVDVIKSQAKAERPLFLYFALNSPHTPIVPSAEWKGKSGLGSYADFVMQTDDAVGRVLTAIDAADLGERTLVCVTSDNGCSPAAGIPALEMAGHFPSASYRGYKADVWEGGHRVPFLARWTGKVPAGSQSEALICLTDLTATVAELLDLPLAATEAEDSISFLPALFGTGRTARTAIVSHSIDGRFVIRDGSLKLNLCAGSGGWGAPTEREAGKKLPPVQLYDLAADPGETQNLAESKPDEVRRLFALLDRYAAEGRSTPGPRQANDVRIDLLKGAQLK